MLVVILPIINLLLDKRVDDIILQPVHDQGEDHHDKCNLQLLIACGPAQCPVSDLGDQGEEDEDNEDANFHAEEPDEVNYGLLEPPPCAGRAAVVA